jgi:PAS domain S-box-containing protein
VADVPTVVLVDDSPEVRYLVRTVLEMSGGLDVVAEGGTGTDAIALARRHQPDLMLLDISMPEMDGLEALPLVCAASPGTRVVMFTGFEEQGLGERVRALGAVALRQKSTSVRRLAEELLALVTGETDPSPPRDRSDRGAPRDRSDEPSTLSSTVLDEHLERFREVFDEAAIGMGTMTLAGRLVRANGALAALVGRPLDSLVGTAFKELLPGDAAARFAEALEAAITTEAGVVQLEHGLVGGGAGLHVRTVLAPIRDSRGVALYLFAQLQDVSKQRAAEAALRQSEERFRLLVDAVTDYAIFMLDPEGRVQSWNAGAQRMKGYTGDEIIGQHFRRFYPAEKQRARHPEHELEMALRDGRYEEEGWRVRRDGTRFWANVVLSAIHDPSGGHVGFAKITRDVTERRRLLVEQAAASTALAEANRELEVANVQLARAAEDQAQFLAATVHELRTPIAILGSAADLLQDERQLKEEDRRQLLESMAANATRLRLLVDDLLMAARLDAQAVVLDLEPVALRPLLTQSVEAANQRAGSRNAHLERCDDDLSVMVDAERLGRILDNLLSNAMNHGRPPVRVSASAVGRMIELRVADSGDGVHADLRDRLFERYATASRTGTGLGLFIVRELARAHGGDAWYEDEASPTFVVSVPRPS